MPSLPTKLTPVHPSKPHSGVTYQVKTSPHGTTRHLGSAVSWVPFQSLARAHTRVCVSSPEDPLLDMLGSKLCVSCPDSYVLKWQVLYTMVQRVLWGPIPSSSYSKPRLLLGPHSLAVGLRPLPSSELFWVAACPQSALRGSPAGCAPCGPLSPVTAVTAPYVCPVCSPCMAVLSLQLGPTPGMLQGSDH